MSAVVSNAAIGRCKVAAWQKSSFSIANGECVELGVLSDGMVAVRDSKDPDGARLAFTRGEFVAFVKGVRAGEFDHLC